MVEREGVGNGVVTDHFSFDVGVRGGVGGIAAVVHFHCSLFCDCPYLIINNGYVKISKK